jgi:hypothetical protein
MIVGTRHPFWLVMVAVLVPFADRAGADDTLWNAALERQKRFAKVDIAFEIREKVQRGSLTAFTKDFLPASSKNEVTPSETVELTSKNRLIFDGDRYRFEGNHPIYNLPTRKHIAKPVILLSEGSTATVFHERGVGSSESPSGIIRSRPTNTHIAGYGVGPLLWHYRGTWPDFCPIPLKELRVESDNFLQGGIACRVYSTSSSEAWKARVFADPANDYRIVRWSFEKNNRNDYVYDVRYDADSVAGWTLTHYDTAGAIRAVSEVRVNQPVTNRSFDASLFRVDFPAGCLVSDQRVSPNLEYRIESDGSYSNLRGDGIVTPRAEADANVYWILALFAAVAVLLYFRFRKSR